MSDPYRGRGSRHGQYQPAPSSHYAASAPDQYSYPVHDQYSSQSTYGYYSTSSPPRLDASVSGHGHQRTSSSGVPRHSTYPSPATSASTSERASKRQKAGTAPPQGAYNHAHWASSTPAHGDPRYPAAGSPSHSSRHRQQERASSTSSGYNSPGYAAHANDPYGQQLLQPPSIPGIGGRPSEMRDPRYYAVRHSQTTSSEYEEEEERVDHGPTELPPRTYSGKSKYDPPRKPGKIPGSAMDYLPILEARFDRLESAIDRYVDYRGQRALSNSILPGMDAPEGSSSRYSHSYSRRRDDA